MRSPAGISGALVSVLLLPGAGLPGIAQSTSTTINYQGRLTDNTPQQDPIDGLAGMRFALYEAETGGTPLWTEPITGSLSVMVRQGIFQVILGANGNPIDPSVFSGGTSRWLEITVNGETLAPRQRLSSVAYAHRSESASSAETAVMAAQAADAARLGGVAASSWQRALAPDTCPAGQVLVGVAQGGSPSCAALPPDGDWVIAGSDLHAAVSGSVGIGTSAPASKLDVAGVVTSDAVLRVGNAVPTIYDITSQRYIVEATPAVVGRVIPLDTLLTDALCRDKDGCLVSLQMVNWDPAGNPGVAAAREERLYVSETARGWRFANIDITGLDNNAAVNDWLIFDCAFSDAEFYTGAPNGRTDSAIGFGLLNVAGGTYSDAATTCRVVLSD